MTKHHYFATNAGRWFTHTDLHRVLKRMDADKLSYDIWFIPHEEELDYHIEYFTPMVSGAVWIGAVKFDNGKRIEKE